MARFVGQAAVLLVVAGEGSDRKLLLTKRAEHLNMHRGEVAFPGGKWEPGDSNLLATALRESCEEVNLQESDIDVIGELDVSSTKSGIAVTPYVGIVRGARPEELNLEPNPEELDTLFWVPLNYFIEDGRERTDIFLRENGREEWAPVYYYAGYKIWGFTARVIVEFINSYCGCDIQRQHLAPELSYKPNF